MAAYVIVRSAVSDPEKYRQYAQASTSVAPAFGGRFLVRGGRTEALEGPAEGRRVVVLEFPDMQKARDWFASPEYQAAKALRAGAAVAEFLLVEGI